MTTNDAIDEVFAVVVARMMRATLERDWLTVRVCVAMLDTLVSQREA